MHTESIQWNGKTIPVRLADALVVGSGAAGYAACLYLKRCGVKDVMLATEDNLIGTSRNAGSDKQTYYKLSLCSDAPDSVRDMAEDLFSGQCVDGDVALAEAASSVRCMMNLRELGVPFPTNRYGEFVGYKTDHDPRARATSAGPRTSRMMVECLERAVRAQSTALLDHCQAVALLRDDRGIAGVLALDLARGEPVILASGSVIWATGGEGGIYADSVYPHGQNGASGMLLAAGALGKNLTEWQYGLASVNPRWNVSGTYMQAMPRFISVDEQGNEYAFLEEGAESLSHMMLLSFQKGYQWPFDSRKAETGSSVVDRLVYQERVVKKRRVYLDYRQNPGGKTIRWHELPKEARDYLAAADACLDTPIQRLIRMNRPAYEFYLENGVDLQTDRLEISLCAQHANGGVEVDEWWRTNLPGLYVIGEAACTHGVYRPGGSALNAGQVGALRAAQSIARHNRACPSIEALAHAAAQPLDRLARLTANDGALHPIQVQGEFARRMSACAAAFRVKADMAALYQEVDELLNHFEERIRAVTCQELSLACKLYDTLLFQKACLMAMLDYLAQGGASRGSGVYDAAKEERLGEQVQLIDLTKGEACWRQVRPIPAVEDAFERVWRGYRENGNID